MKRVFLTHPPVDWVQFTPSKLTWQGLAPSCGLNTSLLQYPSFFWFSRLPKVCFLSCKQKYKRDKHMMPLKLQAWRQHIFTTTHIPLEEASHIAKMKISKVGKQVFPVYFLLIKLRMCFSYIPTYYYLPNTVVHSFVVVESILFLHFSTMHI